MWCEQAVLFGQFDFLQVVFGVGVHLGNMAPQSQEGPGRGGGREREGRKKRERERESERERETHTHTHKPQKQTFDYTAIFSRIN